MLEAGHLTDDTHCSSVWLAMVSLNIEGLEWSIEKIGKSKLDPSNSTNLRELMDDAVEHLRILKKFTHNQPVLRADLNRVYEHVQVVLESNQILIDNVDVTEDNFYGQTVLHLNYAIKSTAVEKCVHMNDELLERIVADEDLVHWDQLVASFVPGDDDTNEQGAEVYAGNA